MLSQSDLDRERYLARIKVQRDELSRLVSAREEGLEKGELIGVIRGYQEWLQQPVTPREQLQALTVEQLQQLAQQVKGQGKKEKGHQG